jgi:hypothetical protein
MPARRIAALGLTFIVAWASLWSLVTAAHAKVVDEPVMLCHDAGSTVAPGTPASRPGESKQHCPLCIMAFYGSAPPSPVVSPLAYSTLSVPLSRYEAPRPHDAQAYTPLSRAPPAAFAA